MKSKKILAVIPARKNSIRIKNKNTKKFNKKSLVEFSVQSSIKSKYITNTCISSDCKRVHKISKKYPVKFISRPRSLSGGKIMPDAAMIHAVKSYKKKFDYVVMLQPTSPLRNTKHIDEAITKIIKEKSDSLLSVFETHGFLWKRKNKEYVPENYKFSKRPRSQDLKQYQENGAIYITKTKTLFKSKNRLGGKISIYKMSFWDSFDINTLEDFIKVEKIIRKN